jgi:hypothetical protein
MKSKRATKQTRTRISRIANAMQANTQEIRIVNFEATDTCRAAVSSLCLLRQVSSVSSHNRGN